MINKSAILNSTMIKELSIALLQRTSFIIDKHIVQELSSITNDKQITSVILVKNIMEVLQSNDNQIEQDIDDINDVIIKNIHENFDSIKLKIDNIESNITANNDRIDNVSNSVNTDSNDISLINTKIDESNIASNDTKLLIDDVNKKINSLLSAIEDMEHLGINLIIGDINDIPDPKENVLYFQKDNNEDPTWLLYVFSKNVQGNWIKIGSIDDIDFSVYWSKDEIQELYESLDIKDNVEVIPKNQLLELVNVNFENFIDDIVKVTVYRDPKLESIIDISSPYEINALKDTNEHLYLVIEHFTTNQIDKIEIGINDIFSTLTNTVINGSTFKLDFMRNSINNFKSHRGQIPIILTAGNIIKSILIDYDIRSELTDAVNSIKSLLGTADVNSFSKLYVGKNLNHIDLEFKLNPEYQGQLDVEFKPIDDTLAQIPVSAIFNDNTLTIEFDNNQVNILEDGTKYKFELDFICTIGNGIKVIFTREAEIIGFDVNKAISIINENVGELGINEAIHVPFKGTKKIIIDQLFKNKFDDLKTISNIDNVTVTSTGANVNTNITIIDNDDAYASIEFSKLDENEYEISYPVKIDVDFNIDGIVLHFSRQVDVYFDASPALYFVFDESTGTVTGLTDEGKTATELVIPSTINGVAVTSIGQNAFKGCTTLASVTIPEGVTSIGYSAFNGCESLTSVTIPEGVTSIGAWAFGSCTSLTNVNISEGVTSIGEYAFQSCTALTSVTIPEGVTSIGYSAFKRCTSLTSVTIPEGVTSIGACAFIQCPLTNLTLPNGITKLGDSAFRECNITSINIPGNVTNIEPGVFYGCQLLKEAIISSGIASIASSLFRECTLLEHVYIPNTVSEINECAFYNCNKLTDVYYEGSQDSWNNITIEKFNSPLESATKHYNYKK